MSNLISRVRRAVTGLAAEDRPGFKRIDASQASYDDGAWLESPSERKLPVHVYS